MNNQSNIELLGHMIVVAGDYPTDGHTSHVFVQQLVHALIDQGVRITVVAPQSIIHALVYKEKLLPLKAAHTSSGGKNYVVLRPHIITFGNTHLFSFFLKRWNQFLLSRLLRKIKPDTLYAHFWTSAQLVGKYARDNSIPLFVACGEGDNALEKMVQSMSDKAINQLSSTVNGVVSVSSENKRKCIEYHLANGDKIGVFPNCVDTDLFKRKDRHSSRVLIGASDEDFIIAFVGGFIPRKGPDRLAKAISLINDPSIKVLFIGKPFSGYPLDFDCPGIIYKGPVDHDVLPMYLSSADIFVLPTQKEGCSNAIVEALSIGLPIISSNGSFNDDILNEKNSIRIDPDDVSSIARAILKLKNDVVLRDQLSEESQSQHETYSIQGRAQQIISFIGGLLAKN